MQTFILIRASTRDACNHFTLPLDLTGSSGCFDEIKEHGYVCSSVTYTFAIKLLRFLKLSQTKIWQIWSSHPRLAEPKMSLCNFPALAANKLTVPDNIYAHTLATACWGSVGAIVVYQWIESVVHSKHFYLIERIFNGWMVEVVVMRMSGLLVSWTFDHPGPMWIPRTESILWRTWWSEQLSVWEHISHVSLPILEFIGHITKLDTLTFPMNE